MSIITSKLGGLAPADPVRIDLCEPFAPSTAQPVLFLDDRYIAHRQGLTRRLGRAEKWGANPILEPEHPWEGRCVILWGSVLWDAADGLFKMWYETYNPLEPMPHHRLCYATSVDGLAWHKPRLGLVAWRGSKANNIVHVGNDVIDSATVVIDPFDPPADQRFKMMLYDHEHRSLVRLASADGLEWRSLGRVPMNGYVGDRHSLMVDAERGTWTIYHRGESCKRTIFMSTSEDFEHWETRGQVLAPNDEDPPETEFYGLIGFSDQGIGLGFLEMFHVLERRLDVQLARLDEHGVPSRYMQGHTFLSRGAWGEWDSAWVCPGNCPPLRVGEELRIYYQGRRTLHWADPPNGTGHIGAIGLARLRPHGYASLCAAENDGQVTTVPLRVSEGALIVNADASGGELRAELLDVHGKPIPNYTASDCYPLRSDATWFKLNWAGRSQLDQLTGQVVRLRLHLRGAKLYGFWFTKYPI